MGIKLKWNITPSSDIAEQLQKQIDEVRATAKDNIMLSYLKYKKYYDRNASAAPLKINDYCYIINPKADNQSTKFAFQDCIWMGPYIVKKVLSNNNYPLRKIGTRYTQTLHRTRIRPYVPEQRIPDATVRANEYLPDPNVRVSHNEWYAASWEMDFGKQIDEQVKSEIENINQQAVTQKVTDTKDEKKAQQETENQNEDTSGVPSPSPDFSNFTADVGDNPNIRRPRPTKVHLFPQNHRLQSLDTIHQEQKSTNYDLILNLRPTLSFDVNLTLRRFDAMTTTH